MDIHSLQEVLLYYKQTEYHPSGLHCVYMTCVSLCIVKHPWYENLYYLLFAIDWLFCFDWIGLFALI